MVRERRRLRAWQSLLVGGIAGATAKTVIAPLDRVKIMYQVSSTLRFSLAAVGRDLHQIVKSEGAWALWRGNTATLLRVIPYAGIQYAAYEQIKRFVGDKQGPLKRFISGAMAGAISVSCTYPLDLLRARLAVKRGRGTRPEFTLLWVEAKELVSRGGFAALWRGLSVTLAGIVPYAGFSFGTFETLKAMRLKRTGETELSNVFRLSSGAFSGLVAQTVTYPLDVVRRRLQVDHHFPPRYDGMLLTLAKIAREEGLRGLYKGMTMNWIKGPIALGISFSVYDYGRDWFEGA